MKGFLKSSNYFFAGDKILIRLSEIKQLAMASIGRQDKTQPVYPQIPGFLHAHLCLSLRQSDGGFGEAQSAKESSSNAGKGPNDTTAGLDDDNNSVFHLYGLFPPIPNRKFIVYPQKNLTQLPTSRCPTFFNEIIAHFRL